MLNLKNLNQKKLSHEFEYDSEKFTMFYKIISTYDYLDIENKYKKYPKELPEEVYKSMAYKSGKKRKDFDPSKPVLQGEDYNYLIRDVNKMVYVGWEDVCVNDEPVEFDPELIEKLPLELQAEFYTFYFNEVISPQLGKFGMIAKNLKSTQRK